MNGLVRYFNAVAGRGSYWARQSRLFEQNRRREAQKEQLEEREEAHLASFTASISIASEIQVRTFKTQLENLETATVQALMTNQEELEEVRARIQHMLSNAHVLNDGRRVFLTENGTQVFDEHGEELDPEEIAPAEIDPALPTWEDYKAERDLEHSLIAERKELLTFQEKLDKAREELDLGEISEARLAELEAELENLAPPAMATPGDEVGHESAQQPKPTQVSPSSAPLGPVTP